MMKPELINVTRRRRLVEELKRYVGALSNQRYDVIRGAVNWQEYRWAGHKKYACAILVDESSLLREFNRCAVTLEFMTQLHGDAFEVDDPELDRMYEDAAETFFHLVGQATDDAAAPRDPDDSSLPLVMRLEPGTDSALEVSDASLKVQGLIATVFVEF